MVKGLAVSAFTASSWCFVAMTEIEDILLGTNCATFKDDNMANLHQVYVDSVLNWKDTVSTST